MEGLIRILSAITGCLFLFCLSTNGATIPTKFLEDNRNGSIVYPKSLYLVGMADGKGFFAENEAELSWIDAKAFCESMNMQMATILSETQATMLNNSYNATTFFSFYWTSGRDVLDLRQFIWDNVDKQPNSNYLKFLKNRGQSTCLYYESNSGDSFLRNFDCGFKMRPLCDTGNLSNNK